MAPTKNRALVAYTNPSVLKTEDIELPTLEPHQVLVKISHVAQNPTDVQSFDAGALGDGAVYGCDFTGEVVDVGSNASRVKKGDVISALIWGGEIKGLGAYSQYCVADEKICFKVPSGTTPDAAATIPLAAATAWLALYSSDCLHIPRGKAQNVLIWGGSSSVGQYAIQLAKLEGLRVITTASERNFELVKSLGADDVFDYTDLHVVEKIKKLGQTDFVFDTIGTSQSSELASLAVGGPDAGTGKLCTVRPGKAMCEKVVKTVEVKDVLVWTVFYKAHAYKQFHWPASKEDHALGSELFDLIPSLLESGKLRPNRVLPLQGLEAVPEGFELHRQKKISAQKIVYAL